MKPWKAILAAVIIFLAGGLSGGMVTHLYRARTERPPPPVVPGGPRMPRTSQHMQMMDRMFKRLNLSPEQRETVEKLMLATQERMREIWKEVSPKAREEMEALHGKIEAELTDDQKERYQALIRERPGRRGSPGSFRHRGGRDREGPDGRDGPRWGPDRGGPRGPGEQERERSDNTGPAEGSGGPDDPAPDQRSSPNQRADGQHD